MIKYPRAVATFVGVNVASAFLGWLAGYNFDQRGVGVALWVASSLFVSVCLAADAADYDDFADTKCPRN